MHYRRLTLGLTLFSALFLAAFSASYPPKNVYDFQAKDIGGNDVPLSKYEGKVLLIVNVASKCGFTPQYAELQKLYDEYSAQGFEILGFPANNFMGQEPGSDQQIKSFCTEKFGVTFPMFSKLSVKGKDIHPLYTFLTQKKENGVVDAPVKWNFQKVLLDRQGNLVTWFAPGTSVQDESVRQQIKKLL